MSKQARDHRCSFCAKSSSEVKKLVTGPSNVMICDQCVEKAKSILKNLPPERTVMAAWAGRDRKIDPKYFVAELDKWVIGQNRAKKMLAVAVYNHYKRIVYRKHGGQALELQKSNILMIGPTGCGKTHMIRTLAQALDVPLAIVDATPLTQAGYVGEDVESILARLIQVASGDLERAARGIIYIDEVDKITKRSGHERDVSGEGVQQGLLRMIEGRRVVVPLQRSGGPMNAERVEIDTSDILFIGGGAFVGLEKILRSQRTAGGIGFASEKPSLAGNTTTRVTPGDLHEFGFIPEFVGRFPNIVTLDPLTESDLFRILEEPKRSLVSQYKWLFQKSGSRLDFTEGAKLAIARRALDRGVGARGLRAVIETLLLDTLYSMPSEPPRDYVFKLEDVERLLDPSRGDQDDPFTGTKAGIHGS